MVAIAVDTQKVRMSDSLNRTVLRSWTLTLVLSRMNRSLFHVRIMWIAKHYFNVDVNVSFNIKSFNDSLIPVLLQGIFCMRGFQNLKIHPPQKIKRNNSNSIMTTLPRYPDLFPPQSTESWINTALFKCIYPRYILFILSLSHCSIRRFTPHCNSGWVMEPFKSAATC